MKGANHEPPTGLFHGSTPYTVERWNKAHN